MKSDTYVVYQNQKYLISILIRSIGSDDNYSSPAVNYRDAVSIILHLSI